MEKIAVYGSGTIGSCEATLIIGHGIPCTVIGHSEKGLERCRKAVAQNWDDLIANGLAAEENKTAALAGCTYVFEAVAEGAAEKQAVYETIAKYAEPGAVVASCSSSMDAEILAGLSPEPENLLIAHPFQPVHMLPLVEVVRHEKTAQSAIDRTLTLLEALHRQVVVLNRSVPGLLVNRFAQALFRESIYLIAGYYHSGRYRPGGKVRRRHALCFHWPVGILRRRGLPAGKHHRRECVSRPV